MGDEMDPADIALASLDHAKANGYDVVLIDTAGRLHIDEELMEELRRVRQAVKPQEILLTVDAMTGQDAVTVAQSFNENLGIDGIIVTKLDSDTRGGAALSVRAVTGKPVKFVGMGEKLDDLEPFHPDRMASRILGMGDVLTLIEKAEQAFDEKKAQEMAAKLMKNKFTLTDYYDQLIQLKSMGNIADIAGMLPGVDAKALAGASIDNSMLSKTEAIILSMTPYERDNPSVLNSSRKKRVAAGSGTAVVDINRLLKQFDSMQAMTKQLTKGRLPAMFKGLGGKGLLG
jgi:signal recognition particle subunit SRP54